MLEKPDQIPIAKKPGHFVRLEEFVYPMIWTYGTISNQPGTNKAARRQIKGKYMRSKLEGKIV